MMLSCNGICNYVKLSCYVHIFPQELMYGQNTWTSKQMEIGNFTMHRSSSVFYPLEKSLVRRCQKKQHSYSRNLMVQFKCLEGVGNNRNMLWRILRSRLVGIRPQLSNKQFPIWFPRHIYCTCLVDNRRILQRNQNRIINHHHQQPIFLSYVFPETGVLRSAISYVDS